MLKHRNFVYILHLGQKVNNQLVPDYGVRYRVCLRAASLISLFYLENRNAALLRGSYYFPLFSQ